MKLRSTLLAFSAGAVVALVGVIAFTAAALPGSYSPYRKLNLFARVLTYIENNYVEHVDDNTLIYGAIKGMLSSLDPHSVFLPPEEYKQMKADTEGEFGGIGIEVEVRDGWLTIVSPLEGTPAHHAGLKSGDRIIAVDNISTKESGMDAAVRAMRGARGTRVRLTIQRNGAAKSLNFDIVRDIIKIVSVSANTLRPGIGYLRVKTFQEHTDEQLRDALETMQKKEPLRGLILDVRNNPGGLLDQAVKVADLFLREGLIVKTIGKGGKQIETETARSKGTFDGFPIVCLVNGGSASASEIVAGALQDHKRAVIMGTRTFGKGSVQTIIDLADGSGLKLTIARYFTPSGRSIQESGIEPDIVVQASAPPANPTRTTPREKDLKGHLPNPQKSTTGKADRNVEDLKATPRLDDFQLQTALDYLRAAEIFRNRE